MREATLSGEYCKLLNDPLLHEEEFLRAPAQKAGAPAPHFEAGTADPASTLRLDKARLDYLKPLERARIELFQYDGGALEAVIPAPALDEDALLPENRLATARAWEDRLYTDLDNVGLVHGIALLWLAWAKHEERRMLSLLKAALAEGVELGDVADREELLHYLSEGVGVTCDPGGGEECGVADCRWSEFCAYRVPPLREMWRKAIACWVTLLNAPDFWESFAGLNRNQIEEVKRECVEAHLAELLSELRRVYSVHGAARLASIYDELAGELETELLAARAMAAAEFEIGLSGGRVSCGPLMLRFLGLLDRAREDVAATLESDPVNEKMRELQIALSPYGRIAALVAAGEWDAAIEEIEELAADERGRAEVIWLSTRAHLEKAHALLEKEALDGAVMEWEAALRSATDHRIYGLVTASVSMRCFAKGTALSMTDAGSAIKLLDYGLRLGRDENAGILLSKLLTRRGLERLLEVQKAVVEATNSGIVIPMDATVAISMALSDLRRAAELGSKSAAEYLPLARQLYALVQVENFRKRSGKAADRTNWDDAIEFFRSVIKRLDGNMPDILRREFTLVLVLRAAKKIKEGKRELLKAEPSVDGLVRLVKIIQEDLREARALDPTSEALKSCLIAFERAFGRALDFEDASLPEKIFDRPMRSGQAERGLLRGFRERLEALQKNPVFWIGGGLALLLAILLLLSLAF